MIKRELYLDKIMPFVGKDIIKVITGVRRSGKSVMLDLIIDELKSKGVPDENIFLINLESLKYQNIKNNIQLNELVLDLTKMLLGKFISFLMRFRMWISGKEVLEVF